MNLRDDLRELKTGPRELRKFGLAVGGVLLALGLLFFLRHKARWPYFLWPGVFLLVFGVVAPRLLKWIYLAWMTLAFVLGFVVSHVLLALLFFLVITPVGLVARWTGKDFLSLKLDRAAKSYWLPRNRVAKRPEDYERQF